MGARKGEKYYKAEAVIIREVNGIKIVFYNKESIYVRGARDEWVIFHRWFAPRGSYNSSWRGFRNKLLYQKRIDLRHCYHLAFQHDITIQMARKAPDLSKFKVKEIFG